MPSRWVSLAIVAFWLSTTGWLFYRDLWPHLRPGEPPPFAVDLLDEIQTKRPPTLWSVRQNGERVFQGRTRIEHPEPEVFELHAEFVNQPGCLPARLPGCTVRSLKSVYRIDPDGNLLGLEVEVRGSPQGGLFLEAFKTDFTLRLHGEVEGDTFRPVLELPSLLTRPFPLTPVRVSRGGSVLLPLHPLNRLRGLRPGQSWTLLVFDPLLDSVQGWQGLGGGPQVLRATVRGPDAFSLGRRQSVPCLVVDLEGEDQQISIWVEERTGQVLRQEAKLDNTVWIMDRE